MTFMIIVFLGVRVDFLQIYFYLFKNDDNNSKHNGDSKQHVVINYCSWKRKELVILEHSFNSTESQLVHMLKGEKKFVQLVEVPSMGVSNVSFVSQHVTIEQVSYIHDLEYKNLALI